MVQGAKPSKRPSHRSWSAEMARAGVRAAGALRTSLADLQYEHDALRQEYDAARAEASSAKKRLAEERHRIRSPTGSVVISAIPGCDTNPNQRLRIGGGPPADSRSGYQTQVNRSVPEERRADADSALVVAPMSNSSGR